MLTQTYFADFKERVDRSAFILKNFGKYFGHTLLDVGCYEAPLRTMAKDVRYTGVDFVGKPDIIIDLEKVERLPFEDAAFDCVICIETLEHLDNLHSVASELFRCAARHVVVSLPNCWRVARVPIARGRGRFSHYGLPVERPVDRHKWFMSFTEIREFYVGIAEKYGATLQSVSSIEPVRASALREFRKVVYPGDRYLNRYAHTCIGVFEVARRGGQVS